jgi:glycerol-3-phosphate cytidylyltransferase-like family protein
MRNKRKQRIYKNAVCFGRMNIPHFGHAELVQKMLEVADVANVYLSTGKKNADWDTRVLMLRHLLREEGVDLSRVNTLKASNPFSAVEDVMDTDNDAVVVLGEDQYELANKLCADYNLGGQLHRRSGSSTQVRELLDHGDFDIVEKIYRGDTYAVRLAAILRKDELRVA